MIDVAKLALFGRNRYASMVEMPNSSLSHAPQHRAAGVDRAPNVASAMGRLTDMMDSRYRLATLDTPLHLMTGLSAQHGREVWVKRDDLTGTALGGNKVRKLELIVAEAKRQEATALVTVGGPQSNHARSVAAAAAMAGLDCHLVLGGAAPASASGNLILNQLFGAQMHFIGEMNGELLASTASNIVDELTADGTPAFLVPLGGSTPLGVLAYAAAYLELSAQFDALGLPIPTIVHASGSGGTQAGLELGRHLAGTDHSIIGVNVAGLIPDLPGEVNRLVREAGKLLGLDDVSVAADVDERYLGTGYGIASEQSSSALRALARSDGIIADPVYTAKALWAIAEMDGPERVLFWHTGGTPAVFAEGVGYGGSALGRLTASGPSSNAVTR